MYLTVRIGIPRGLLYYHYEKIWKAFLRELGAQVVVSGETSKRTLNYGSVLDEVCLPVKAYFGHVYEIAQDVDYLFVPRIVSTAKGQYTCPEIIGLPDMLRSNIPKLPKLIDINVNFRKDWRNLYQAITTVGKMLQVGPAASLYAWQRAWRSGQQQTWQPIVKSNSLSIGLIGHPYIIYDRQISMNVLDKLQYLGINVVTPDMVDADQARKAAAILDKKIFWCYCSHLAGAAFSLMQPARVDGVIFMTSFSCGPDSLIGEVIKQHAQSLNVPFMLLTVDEHTSEAGFITRLEAFIDMLGRRRQL
jgi:predicted nucleotide-binding protein (sugar kinase/HSP70/actin superfamily)